jgi:hypothetical protein
MSFESDSKNRHQPKSAKLYRHALLPKPQGVVQLATTSHMKPPAAVAGSMPDTFIELLSRGGTVALARATFGLLYVWRWP